VLPQSLFTLVRLRPSRLNAGGSDPLPLTCFRLRDLRFTVRGCLRQPVHRPSRGYGGTAAVTTAASPSADVDRARRVAVSRSAACPTARMPHRPRARATHRHHGGHRYAQVSSHDARRRPRLRRRQGYATEAIHLHRLRLMRSTPGLPNDSAGLDGLQRMAIGPSWPCWETGSSSRLPARRQCWLVPWHMGLPTTRTTSNSPALPDHAGITQRLIRDGAGQGGREVRGAGALALALQHATVERLPSSACTSTVRVWRYSWQWARRRVACAGVGDSRMGTVVTSAHVLDCLSLDCWMLWCLTVPAVLTKTARVHQDGNVRELRPWIRRGMSEGRVVGVAWRKRWTGSG